MKLFINFLHATVGMFITFTIGIGLTQLYVRTFGADDGIIIVAAVSLFVGVWLATEYCIKFITYD